MPVIRPESGRLGSPVFLERSVSDWRFRGNRRITTAFASKAEDLGKFEASETAESKDA
jgi:hypothetical protein